MADTSCFYSRVDTKNVGDEDFDSAWKQFLSNISFETECAQAIEVTTKFFGYKDNHGEDMLTEVQYNIRVLFLDARGCCAEGCQDFKEK